MARRLGSTASGYVRSALALARAAGGDVSGAQEAASALTGLGATYSDRVTAATALALAAARVGDGDGADRHLADAREILEDTDDRHARNLLTLAAATVDRALGRPVAPGAGAEAAAASPGWATAYRVVAGLGETGD
jgi:hypothetical protein